MLPWSRCCLRKLHGPARIALTMCPARLVATCLDKSGLVATCRNFSILLWPQGQDLGSLYLKTFRPDASRLHPSGLQFVSVRPEGRRDGPADLARSTAEGVGGVCSWAMVECTNSSQRKFAAICGSKQIPLYRTREVFRPIPPGPNCFFRNDSAHPQAMRCSDDYCCI